MEKKELEGTKKDWIETPFGEFWTNELNKIVDDFFAKEEELLNLMADRTQQTK